MSQRFTPEYLEAARIIQQRVGAALKAQGHSLDAETPIPADLRLLGSGLDSLGFATLVVQLEGDFGYDPFALLEEPFYPSTYGELEEVYLRFWQDRCSVRAATVLDNPITIS